MGVSFPDCPNKCIDGFYINPYQHRRIKCAYCEEKRRQAVTTNSSVNKDNEKINEVLNLPSSFVGYGNFEFSQVLPDYAVKVMEPESVEMVGEKLASLIKNISVGEVSEDSLLFNLGKKAFENNFIYVYLVRAYIAGLKVSPFISSYELNELRNGSKSIMDLDIKYSDFIKTDVCVVSIDAGATSHEILAVKGLMQIRAQYSKSTIVFTNAWNGVVMDMCTEDGKGSRSLALLYSIEYNKKYLEREKNFERLTSSSNIRNNAQGLSSDEFNNLLNSKTNL